MPRLETTPLDAKKFSDSTRAYSIGANGWITLTDTETHSSVVMHELELEHIVDEFRTKRELSVVSLSTE